MERTYWHKQDAGKPLFPDLLWSRPENKRGRGKLLIVGGNTHGFAAPAEAYREATAAGAGSSRVLLPNSLHKIAGQLLETVEFGASTPSGSFSQQALNAFLEQAAWADSVLMAGDLGRNSETAVMLEKSFDKYSGQATLVKDAVDYAINFSELIIDRPETLLVLTVAQLQKLFVKTKQITSIRYGMDLLHMIDVLHEFTTEHALSLLLLHSGHYIVASGGKVSTTPTDIDSEDFWRIKAAAHAAVWWMQNPAKTFEAISSSLAIN